MKKKSASLGQSPNPENCHTSHFECCWLFVTMNGWCQLTFAQDVCIMVTDPVYSHSYRRGKQNPCLIYLIVRIMDSFVLQTLANVIK